MILLIGPARAAVEIGAAPAHTRRAQALDIDRFDRSTHLGKVDARHLGQIPADAVQDLLHLLEQGRPVVAAPAKGAAPAPAAAASAPAALPAGPAARGGQESRAAGTQAAGPVVLLLLVLRRGGAWRYVMIERVSPPRCRPRDEGGRGWVGWGWRTHLQWG